MKRPMFIATLAAVALSTLAGGAAMADSNGRDRHREERRWHDRDDRRHEQRHSHERRDWDSHRGRHEYRRDGRDWDRHHSNDRHYRHHGRYKVVRYYPPHGYRHYRWHRGAYLPAAYYAPRYIVRDYHSYHLYAPPRGYHWVRVGNDVILAAVATGLVMNVISDIFY